MAVVKVHNIYKTLGKSIKYVMNPAKTRNGLAFDVLSNAGEPWDWSSVAFGFNITNNQYETERTAGAKRKVLAWHIIQSFAPGETDKEEAHRLGEEFVQRIGHGNYDFVLATHHDRDHIHNHIIISTVNRDTLRQRYYVRHTQRLAWRSTLTQLRSLSDALCASHGLSVINDDFERSRARPRIGELYAQAEGRSRKDELRAQIDMVAIQSHEWSQFVSKMREFFNVHVQIRGQEIIFHAPDLLKKNVRGSTLGAAYTERSLMMRLGREQVCEFIVANNLVRDIGNHKFRVRLPHSQPPLHIIVDERHLLRHPNNWRMYLPAHLHVWPEDLKHNISASLKPDDLYQYFTRPRDLADHIPAQAQIPSSAAASEKQAHYFAAIDRSMEHFDASMWKVTHMQRYLDAEDPHAYLSSLIQLEKQLGQAISEAIIDRQIAADDNSSPPVTSQELMRLRREKARMNEAITFIRERTEYPTRNKSSHNLP